MKYKITPIFKGQIEQGKFKMADEDFSRYQKWLLSHGGEYQFIIQKKFKKRSLPANAYFHGVVIPMIAEETGMDEAEVKAFLKAKFLSKEVVMAGKDNQWETAVIVGRSSKADSHTFGLFLEKCVAWASSFLGLVIPEPDPDHNNYPILIDND